MRTGRALTVSGGGGVNASQKEFFGGKRNWKKKEKQFWSLPKIWRPPLRKIGDQRPPQNLETPPQNWRTPLLLTEILTHAYENITLAQLRCGR